MEAAKAAVFEPVIKDGKAVEERLSIGYRLRPIVSPLPQEQRKIVSIGVANGRATSLPTPKYPEEARSARLSGSITVQILVGENGSVLSAGSISGHPHFAAAGATAACSARFSPMTLEKQPAKMSAPLYTTSFHKP